MITQEELDTTINVLKRLCDSAPMTAPKDASELEAELFDTIKLAMQMTLKTINIMAGNEMSYLQEMPIEMEQ